MKNILILLVTFIPQLLLAQLSYQALDSLSSVANQLQKTADGTTASVSGIDSYISFPEQSFGILFYNKLAFNVVYYKNNNKEYIKLTESIDLSKSTSVRLIEERNHAMLAITFQGSIPKTTVYQNGKMIEQERENDLTLYCRIDNKGGSLANHEKFLLTIAYIINVLKEEKGSLQKGRALALNEQWLSILKTEFPQNIDALEVFIKKNKNSILENEALRRLHKYKELKMIVEVKKKEAQSGLEKARSLMKLGHLSLNNYSYYYQVDTLTTRLLKTHNEKEIGKQKIDELGQLQTEARYRYKWNKAYADKKDKILEYDRLTREEQELKLRLTRKSLNQTVIGGGLVIVGILTGMTGLIVELSRDESSGINTWHKIAIPSFTTGLVLMIGADSDKRTNRKLKPIRTSIQQLTNDIGKELLDKRNETYMGRPLINK